MSYGAISSRLIGWLIQVTSIVDTKLCKGGFLFCSSRFCFLRRLAKGKLFAHGWVELFIAFVLRESWKASMEMKSIDQGRSGERGLWITKGQQWHELDQQNNISSRTLRGNLVTQLELPAEVLQTHQVTRRMKYWEGWELNRKSGIADRTWLWTQHPNGQNNMLGCSHAPDIPWWWPVPVLNGSNANKQQSEQTDSEFNRFCSS